MPAGRLHVFFEKMSVQVFCSFFSQVVWSAIQNLLNLIRSYLLVLLLSLGLSRQI